jgi:hypothetical protein
VTVSFIGGGNQNTRRKPPTCRKSRTKYYIILYQVHLAWAGFELTTSVVIGTSLFLLNLFLLIHFLFVLGFITIDWFWYWILWWNQYRRLPWPWSYGSWIYNYLCNQCLSLLKLWVRIQLRRGVLDTILCNILSLTCGRSVIQLPYDHGHGSRLYWFHHKIQYQNQSIVINPRTNKKCISKNKFNKNKLFIYKMKA